MGRTAGAILAAMVAFAATGAAADEAARVHALIAERLGYMKDVAVFKDERGIAVEDVAREKVVLDAATEAAADKGLEAQSVRAFFAAQIEAAKAIQFCFVERWDGDEARPSEAMDLRAKVRPALIRLGEAIVAAIVEAKRGGAAIGEADAFARAVDLECLDDASRDAIAAALREVELAS